MPQQRLTLSVPTPCQGNWHSMTVQTQGRFCGSCQKTVVDFTTMADAEIVYWLNKQKGNTCGRFRQQQLERELAATQPPRQKWAWQTALLGLAVWLNAKPAEAQVMKASLAEATQASNSSKSFPCTTPPSTPASFLGIVLDQATKEPMPGVSVQLAGTSVAISTDAKGQFKITVPPHLPLAEQSLVISFIGYLKETVQLKDLASDKKKNIMLRPDPTPLKEVIVVAGAVAIVKNPPVHQNKKQPSFFRRVKEKLF